MITDPPSVLPIILPIAIIFCLLLLVVIIAAFLCGWHYRQKMDKQKKKGIKFEVETEKVEGVGVNETETTNGIEEEKDTTDSQWFRCRLSMSHCLKQNQ